MQQLILEDLHKLLSCNVAHENSYKSRYKGFYGEFEFLTTFKKAKLDNKISPDTELYDGGFFLPVDDNAKSSLENSCYVTISRNDPNSVYKDVYSSLHKIVRESYFINYDSVTPFDRWKTGVPMSNGEVVRIPIMTVYHFNSKKGDFEIIKLDEFKNIFSKMRRRNQAPQEIRDDLKRYYISKLSKFSIEILIDAYMDRLVFDGIIGFLEVKRSDIDAISVSDRKISFLEIKEKDRSKRHPSGFGMDTRRIADIEKIRTITGIPYRYIVREVKDQKNRELLKWKVISMDKFAHITKLSTEIEGGVGMRSIGTSNPTKICPYDEFSDLESFN